MSEFLDAWDLFREAVICGALAGATLGFLGIYVVLRRMVFVSAAITQAAALGVAVAFYAAIHWGFTVDPIWGAIAASLLATGLLLPDPQPRLGITRETVLGLAFALAGGLSVIVGARIAQEANELTAILFGSAVLVRPEDLRALMIVSALVTVVHVWGFRGLTFATFDAQAARVQGLPVALLAAVIMVSIGLTVGVSARALGALPVFAFSTLPATAALLVSRRRLVLSFVLAAAGGALAGGGGFVLAYFEDWPVGAAQTCAAALLVVVALLVRGASFVLRRRGGTPRSQR